MNKKFTKIFFVCVFTFLGFATSVHAFSGPGAGTSLNPYVIFNCVQLQEMVDELDASYVLDGDIDCADTANWNGLKGFGRVGDNVVPFTGEFDGQGHTISNLFMNWDSDYIGLFGYADGATITDFRVSNAQVSGQTYTGGLIGYANNVTLSSVIIDADVNGLDNTGGVIGYNYGSSITESGATGSVSGSSQVGGFLGYSLGAGALNKSVITESYATGDVTASGDEVGGFVGLMSAHTLFQNSYARGDVSGADSVGGFGGSMSALSVIEKTYATGEVVSDGFKGGLIGIYAAGEGGQFLSNFWDVTTSGISDDASNSEVVGTTTGWMKVKDTFTAESWDFTTVWGINNYTLSNSNNNYPYLRWQGITDIYFDADVATVDAESILSTGATVSGTMDVADDWTWEDIDDLPDTILFIHLNYGTSSYPYSIAGGVSHGSLNLYTYYPSFANDFTIDTDKPDLDSIASEFVLTDLECDTTYYYRISGGLSRYPLSSIFFGDEKTFTTLPCPVEEDPPSTSGSSNRSGSSIVSRVSNLLEMGKIELAEELMRQFPDAFPDQVVALSTQAPAQSDVSVPAACILGSVSQVLRMGSVGDDVRRLQQFLNCLGFTVASNGAGSVGNETTTFLSRTRNALIKFQEHYASDILEPLGLKNGTGIFGPLSKKKAEALSQ